MKQESHEILFNIIVAYQKTRSEELLGM
jgi:hypothetical protein